MNCPIGWRYIQDVRKQNLQGAAMSLEKRVKATAKNIEGKIQEAVGELTGDPLAKEEGKAKQTEAAVSHTIEDVKDEVRKKLD
jgi:uncharacterized protein YjbJ (UPF0337 family)